MAEVKPEFTTDFQEFETRDAGYEKRQRTARMVESVRFGTTLLALLAGVTILGTSADTLSVYNKTHLPGDFLLDLWPAKFDIRPTEALVICSAIIFIASTISLIVMKVQAARNNPLIHSTVSFVAPAICLIAALIGISFFYGVNTSNTVNSLKSWTCQWSSVSMNVQPYWGQLCKESKAALYLMILIIPVEVIVLSTVAFGTFVEKKHLVVTERKGSPALS